MSSLSAIENGDEHVIKFTEACLQRYTLGASPAYLAAVDHARGVIPRRGGTLRRPADNF